MKSIFIDLIKSILIVVTYPVSFIYTLYQRQKQLREEYQTLDD